jgi:D-gamma-glutamyl-meso-diaminopimelic acid endopeptidase CwlS/peptidoglycan endopeptidase LytE
MYNSYDGMKGFKDFDAYVVKKGDSLYKIAKEYNTTVEAIKNANNLATETIYPNQVLFIPLRGNSGMYQTVEGDTLRVVFEKLGLNLNCLKCYEPMLDILLIPNQVIETVHKNSGKMITYSGETIEEFLTNNEIDAMNLLKLNKNNWLMPGTSVRIL